MISLRSDSEPPEQVVNGVRMIGIPLDRQYGSRSRYLYGRRGTPTSEALETALRELEGPDCAGVALLPSGLAAISTALLSVLQAGDHVLVTDSIYLPTRKFCDDVLKRYGIETTYYDPMIGSGIARLMKSNTRAVFVEAPGPQSPSKGHDGLAAVEIP